MRLGEPPGAGRSAIPSIDNRPPAKLAVDDLAAATRRLDPLAGGSAEGMRVHRERLAELALGEHLDWHVLAWPPAPGSRGEAVQPYALLWTVLRGAHLPSL